MRRRIYIDPESDLSDNTRHPYLYDLDQDPTEPLGICRTGALYNDDLWDEYQRACAKANELRGRVVRELRNEPYDEVETRLALRSRELLDSPSVSDEWDAIEAEALSHAVTVEPNP